MTRDGPSAAPTVQRLGVLLQAGIAPVAAWRAVAEDGAGPIARTVAERVESSHELPDAIAEACRAGTGGGAAGVGWRQVAAAWRVAADSGAPLGPTLARLAEVVRGSDRAERRVRTALTGPIATVRVLVVLPIAGLLLGLVLGFDTGRVLFATVPGWLCLATGGVLLLVAGLWMRSLLRAARAGPAHPGLEADLVAIALGGGVGPDAAVTMARSAMVAAGLDADGAAEATVAFARRSGVPASGLLRAEADDERDRAADEAEGRAEALGVRLILPLGLCILPSFVVLGVVPILLSLIGSLDLG